MSADLRDPRLAEIMHVIIGVATHEFSRRATVGDGDSALDAIAAGVNMLAEEVERRVDRERAYQTRAAEVERLAAVGQLAASVAHEVSNPASFALANLTALEERLASLRTAPPETLRACLDDAEASVRESLDGVRRVLTIVGDLRGFARTDEARFVPVSLAEVVDDACKLTFHQVTYRARLIKRLDGDAWVRGDATRLTQLVINLLLNASQAIAGGASQDDVVEVSAARSGGQAVLRVRDTGAGMSDEVRARIFEPFFTPRARDHGTGLGLAVCADIARLHGGEITVRSDAGSGSVFEVRLPAVDAAPARTPVIAPAAPVPARLRVLVIDDEEPLLRAYRRLLGGVFDLTTADGGREALARLAVDDAWDAIFCDLMMPDVDGRAVHAWVVAERPALAPRLIFCTGGTFTPGGVAFASTRGEALLHKPISREQFVAAALRARGGAQGEDAWATRSDVPGAAPTTPPDRPASR
ncbi:MAG: hybrid sensor histidine kinase/response regulator [Polyangiales bacterium]